MTSPCRPTGPFRRGYTAFLPGSAVSPVFSFPTKKLAYTQKRPAASADRPITNQPGSAKARAEHADNERRDKENRAADLGGLCQLGVDAALTARSHKAVIAHDGGRQALALAFLSKSENNDKKRNGNQNNAENDLVNAH